MLFSPYSRWGCMLYNISQLIFHSQMHRRKKVWWFTFWGVDIIFTCFWLYLVQILNSKSFQLPVLAHSHLSTYSGLSIVKATTNWQLTGIGCWTRTWGVKSFACRISHLPGEFLCGATCWGYVFGVEYLTYITNKCATLTSWYLILLSWRPATRFTWGNTVLPFFDEIERKELTSDASP